MALDPGKGARKRKSGAKYAGRDKKNKRKRGSGGPTQSKVGYGQLHPSKTEGFGPQYTEDGSPMLGDIAGRPRRVRRKESKVVLPFMVGKKRKK